MKRKIIIRADGNSQIGLGHIYRALALLEMLNDQFDCSFATKENDPVILDLIAKYCNACFVIRDENVIQPVISNSDEKELPFDLSGIVSPGDWIVTDGHYFGANYQKAARQLATRLVCVSDFSSGRFFADLIINHGDGSKNQHYDAPPGTKILAGLQYLIVRGEFLERAQQAREINKIDTVCICMGGADPFNVTIRTLEVCLELEFVKKIIVITGSAYQNKADLSELIERDSPGKKITHEQNLSAPGMIDCLVRSEIVICPASTIAMETVCVKAGLVTGTVADNQFATHEQLLETGSAISVGNFNELSVPRFKEVLQSMNSVSRINSMMSRQYQAVDGLSGKRIAAAFKELAPC